MKQILSGLALIAVIISSCNSSDKKISDPKDKAKYEETKESLGETEKKNPEQFLTVTGHDKHNLIGQTVIKGTLVNNAKVASYKDVNVELAFYSKTGTLLEKDNETVYEVIAPGGSNNFKTKYFAPKGTDSVALKVTSAKSVDEKK